MAAAAVLRMQKSLHCTRYAAAWAAARSTLLHRRERVCHARLARSRERRPPAGIQAGLQSADSLRNMQATAYPPSLFLGCMRHDQPLGCWRVSKSSVQGCNRFCMIQLPAGGDGVSAGPRGAL